mmetsp:Transcript_19951/g.63458  ORF Transcript_19951/g.63458 Transcript_19951/m.63458 type:complete len:237 (+) Transcript_19951:1348-2058(+)
MSPSFVLPGHTESLASVRFDMNTLANLNMILNTVGGLTMTVRSMSCGYTTSASLLLSPRILANLRDEVRSEVPSRSLMTSILTRRPVRRVASSQRTSASSLVNMRNSRMVSRLTLETSCFGFEWPARMTNSGVPSRSSNSAVFMYPPNIACWGCGFRSWASRSTCSWARRQAMASRADFAASSAFGYDRTKRSSHRSSPANGAAPSTPSSAARSAPMASACSFSRSATKGRSANPL